ncbi:MAG: hypothetical protein AAFY73_10925 [Pseudomonadota bacterium]
MKNLLIATALSFGMTAAAIAASATIETAGTALVGSDVLMTDGTKVGVVQEVIDAETLAIEILNDGVTPSGEVVELKRESFALIEDDSDADAAGYQINLNSGVMLK